MKPATKSIVSGMVLALCAVVVGFQAWLVGDCWWTMYFGTPDLLTPWWFVERGLITAFAFYSSIAVVRLLHHQRAWIPILLCLIAFGLCMSPLIYHTLWGLPTFVGLHLVALACIIVRFIASLFPQASAADRVHPNPDSRSANKHTLPEPE